MSGPHHIARAEDLITTPAETRAGFIEIALEKNDRADRYIKEARALKAEVRAAKVEEPSELLRIPSIRPALLTASGLSEKALEHLNQSDKEDAIQKLVDKFLLPAGENFIDELIYRFLLIRGESFGGEIKNVLGRLAEKKFKLSVIAALNMRKMRFFCLSKRSKEWFEGSGFDGNIEDIAGIHWEGDGPRTLILNKKVKFTINKNIDVCLIASPHDEWKESMGVATKYLALGELKGGIDPAGADEHWKTARSSLERIISGFEKERHGVQIFFIAAAIAPAMAEEIWEWLESGKLRNAGNLTNSDHVAGVCRWLIDN
ncbi:MAG: type II restriction endonuclease [Pirellulales bacterium]|nr:type II restriction endonuclease [Pirellulales bacterium]